MPALDFAARTLSHTAKITNLNIKIRKKIKKICVSYEIRNLKRTEQK